MFPPQLLMAIAIFLLCVGCQPASTEPSKIGSNNTATAHSSESVPLPLARAAWHEGWIRLFDGETLFGWKTTGNVDWQIEDHTIVAKSGEMGFLYTTTRFSDYVLRLQYRCPESTNSGIFLHMTPQPTDPAQDCYEVNIAPSDNPFPTGSIVARQKVDPPAWQDDWHQFEIHVSGPDIVVKINDIVVNEFHDSSTAPLARGHIGLQHNEGLIEFRDIRLKPLHTQSLFNGVDLSGWAILPDLDSEFSVTEAGELHISGGKGQIETESQFDDFVLQLECQTGAPGLNSGVFFRCIPGDFWMGYESQIQHEFIEGDRTRPVDCGTGGIFRRQPARRIVADDQEWFTKTIIADGPHLAVWVNGYHVTDWVDAREAHENPRKGLRTAAGTIILQGHDPTTDLLFSNLRISPLQQRPTADSL